MQHRIHGPGLATGTTVALLVLASCGPATTLAAWTDDEHSSTSLRAGSVSPVTSLRCTAGVLQQVDFTWSHPTGGLERKGYRWTVTGGLTGSGTLPPDATSVTLTGGALGLGRGTFSLYTQGPEKWESAAATGQFSLLSGLLSTCHVP